VLSKFDSGLVAKDLLVKRGLYAKAQREKVLIRAVLPLDLPAWAGPMMLFSVAAEAPAPYRASHNLALRGCLRFPHCLLPLRHVLLSPHF